MVYWPYTANNDMRPSSVENNKAHKTSVQGNASTTPLAASMEHITHNKEAVLAGVRFISFHLATVSLFQDHTSEQQESRHSFDFPFKKHFLIINKLFSRRKISISNEIRWSSPINYTT